MPVAAAGTEVPAPPPPYRCTEGAGTSGRPEHTGNPNPTPFLRERTTSYAVSPRPTHKTTTPPLPSPPLPSADWGRPHPKKAAANQSSRYRLQSVHQSVPGSPSPRPPLWLGSGQVHHVAPFSIAGFHGEGLGELPGPADGLGLVALPELGDGVV